MAGRRDMAMVAKYTPLTREELCGGAFDVRWFKESYEQLGEKDFLEAVYYIQNAVESAIKYKKQKN